MTAAPMALTGGAWVTGRGGIRRWQPTPPPPAAVQLAADPTPTPPPDPVVRRRILQDLADQFTAAHAHVDEPLGRICGECDSLVFTGELGCLVCLTWAERDAVAASWRVRS